MRVTITLSITAALLIWNGCSQQTPGNDPPAAADPVVVVKTVPIRQGNVDVLVEATGKTEAQRKETVLSPISGMVIRIAVLEGATVKPGDTLAVIQSRESQQAIAGAEALAASALTLEQKQEAAQALKLARATQNLVPIKAVSGGVVAGRNVSEGELVAENTELFTLVDLSTLDFIAEIPLRDAAAIKVGQESRIQFPSLPEKIFAATVRAFSPQSDISSQTLRARLEFTPASGRRGLLTTGMVGTAFIVVGEHEGVLLAPKSALLRDDETNTYSIMTVTSDSLAVTHRVQIGVVTDATAEISGDDLRLGTPVITEGHYALSDSTRVSIGPQRVP